MKKHGGFPAGFSETDDEEVILGTVSLGPPDPRIASDAFLWWKFFGLHGEVRCPLFFWGGGCCSYLRNVGVVVIYFRGEHEPRKALNDGGFFIFGLKVGILFNR